MQQLKKYDRARLEQGGKNVFQEINHLAKIAHDVHDENPEEASGVILTKALDRGYPEVKRKIAHCAYKI